MNIMANLKIFICNLLLVLTTLIHLCISTQVEADELRPNIVLIMADDLSHKNLSCYGATNFETPNLDKLAATGMRFEHCYSMPLCTPSRVMLMTGQHNGRNFYRASTLEADQRTFGHVANEAGYETCVVGKWKLTGKSKESTPDRFGFDEHYVTEGLRNDSPRYKNPEILANGKPIKYSDGEYGPDIVCDHAIEFIERKRNEPFLLYYPMILVHTPLSPVPGSPGYAAADQRTDDKSNYPAMVRRMDENVGRIIAKLDELGLRERTLIFFTGDNGTKSGIEMKLKDGSVYLGGKGSTRDNGVHVPLIVNQPGRVPVGVSDALVSFTDFLPTVADIAGSVLAPNIPCDGRSFLAQCLGKSEPSERESIYQWFSNNPLQDKLVEVAFDQDYRLYGDGSFFNWSADSSESKPLNVDSLDGAAQHAYAKLQQTLHSHRKGLNRAQPAANAAAPGLSGGNGLAASDFKALGLEFVLVERGEFSEGAEDNKANPIRESSVPDNFWIATHEVTQDVYESTIGTNPSTQKADGHPVESVSWHDAVEFCRRLTESSGASGMLPNGHVVRLPTSTEWEWAARGGNKSQDHPFAGSSKAKDVGWIGSESSEGHHPVGEKQPNELGLYDMTGNVWEWCIDSLPVDRSGKPGEDTRIKRGGSYFNNEKACFITNIGEMSPSGKGPRFGFRVVIGKPLQQKKTTTSQSVRPSTKQPNILWIVTDDQRSDSIAAFNRICRNGAPESALGQVLSPNVDRLAAMGTTFINTFNQNPCCQPSRTIMHTGRYSHRTGVYGFEYHNPMGMKHWKPMVPEILRDEAGYQTLTVGKLGLYAQHYVRRNNPGGAVLYQTNLGYRDEFAAKGLVDWHSEKERAGGKAGPKTESFYFADGKKLFWREQPGVAGDDSNAINQRLDLFRAYDLDSGKSDLGGEGKGGEILGGLNPQASNKTRDANFSSALLDHLSNTGREYTDVLGRTQTGPDPAKPVFIHCGFEFPHTPVLPPAEFREKFSKQNFEIPKFTEAERAQFPPQTEKFFKQWATNHFTDAEKQQMVADYYAYCAYGDSLVGQLADGFIQYSEANQRPWLILYVCGDNGWKLNEHGMGAKFLHYDEDLHNPVIVISSDKKRFPAGKVVMDFTGFVDMAPTFLAVAGIDVSTPRYEYLDGRDLAQTAASELRPRDYVIAEPTWVIGPRAVIRTKDYKFAMRVRPHAGNAVTKATCGKDIDWAIDADLNEIEPTLFALRLDPAEQNNVAFEPRYREVLDAMRTKLQDIVLGDSRVEVAWSKDVGDEVHISNFAPGADDGILKVPAPH